MVVMMFHLFLKSLNKDKLPSDRIKKLKELCKKLRIKVNALSFLDRALTHSSYIEKSGDHIETYERLEFLGDSILNASIAYFLYINNPHLTEGGLSAFRSSLVDEKTLSEIALSFDIHKYINLGKGETLTDFRAREKVTADIMESIIAVVFLEKGFWKAFDFITKIMDVHIKKRLETGTRDFKTQLQKWSVAKFKEYPAYTITSELGPDHNKIFEIKASVGNCLSASAKGRTKKDAEQKAAEKIWLMIQNEVQIK